MLVCDLGLITASRDRTLKVWKEEQGQYTVQATLAGHGSYVTAISYIRPGLVPSLPAGAIVSGDAAAQVLPAYTARY